MPAGTPVAWSDLSEGVSAAQQALRQGAARGAAMLHYFGHAGPEIWADEGLLTRDDVDVLAGTPESVLFTWACEAQWYQYLFGDTINEALLLLPRGGALASFGPAGITEPARQEVLRRKLYGLLLGKGLSLGEAIQRAKAEALAEDTRARTVVEGWNLLGDPALRFEEPRAAGRR
jgi:peptidase C25-like protein